MFLGYPNEIWIALIVSILVKLQSSRKLSIIGAATTIFVAVASGLLLYKPIMDLLSLNNNWEVIVAILVALTAENLMRNIVEMSADRDIFQTLMQFFIIKKIEKEERSGEKDKIIIIKDED